MTPAARDQQRNRRWRYKLTARCVDCNAGLQEDDCNQCVECAEKARVRSLRYATSEHGRAQHTKTQRSRRAQLKAEGRCTACGRQCTTSKVLCEFHVQQRRRLQSEANARKRQGITPIRSRPATVTHEPEPVLLEPESWGSLRPRIARALRHFDWVSASDVLSAIGVEDWGSGEHNNGLQQFTRLVRSGDVERRGPRGAYEYRLTEQGRRNVQQALQKARAA